MIKEFDTHSSDTLAANKLITLVVPCFKSIAQLYLQFEGTAATLANIKSSVTNISVLANGEQIVNITPKNLANLYAMLGNQIGLATPVNNLPLFLGQLLYKTQAEKDFFMLGCENFGEGQPLTNLQVQIQCSGTITGLSTVQVNSLRCDKGTGNNVTAAICKVLSYPQNFTSTGTSECDSLPRDSAIGRVCTLCVPLGSGVISDGEALTNNKPVYQKSSIGANNMLLSTYGFSPVSGCYGYVFTDGTVSSMLSMEGVTDMRLKTTFSTPPSGYDLIDVTVAKR